MSKKMLPTVYKIGSSYYNGREDRNGGSHEEKIIRKFIYDTAVKNGFDEKVAFVINGLIDNNSDKSFNAIRQEHDAVIFIFTDAGFYDMNKKYISRCDFILHQSPMNVKFEGVSGAYGYMPEMFYDESIPVSKFKKNMILFGGNLLGREDDFSEFVFEKDGVLRSKVFLLYKESSERDFRIEYNNYRKFMSMFKYAYVSGREAGRDIGWVTPRLVETVNAGCYPILIGRYDKFKHFGFSSFESWGQVRELIYGFDFAVDSDAFIKSEVSVACERIKLSLEKAKELYAKLLRGNTI